MIVDEPTIEKNRMRSVLILAAVFAALIATGGNELTLARFVVGLGIIGAGLLLRQRALKA